VLDEGDEAAGREAPALARIYFDDAGDAYSSAVFRALVSDRLHFRRRAKAFTPRSGEEIEQLRAQRAAEQQVVQEQEALEHALRERKPDAELCGRLERHLRLRDDKQLAGVLEQVSRRPERYAFDLLRAAGHVGPTADLEVIQANLRTEMPAAVIAHAASLERSDPAPAGALESAFSIDDPDTREVDDALSVRLEGDNNVVVAIDIADVAALVQPGDPVDEEAQRRATTVYLPTGVIHMLPERIGCDLASLTADAARPVLRTTVHLDFNGRIESFELTRTHARVTRRLNYEEADALLDGGEGGTADALRLLQRVADGLAARRRSAGAISFRQREWKLKVAPDGTVAEVKQIPLNSPSRALVAEMMILGNSLAARLAAERSLPIIYRIQPPPSEVPPQVEPDDPAAFIKLRGLLQPAALSLQPARHWGLGLDRYTQSTSPLRRYPDLVIQRQLCAALAGDPLPYRAEELLRVLATAEATEKEIKRLENTVTSRWALEYAVQQQERQGLQAWVLDSAPAGGWRVVLATCGAQGILDDPSPHDPGEMVRVDIKTLKPLKGVLRLVTSR
jgi:exoribonuclease-2